jgi:hypothetical protein
MHAPLRDMVKTGPESTPTSSLPNAATDARHNVNFGEEQMLFEQ